MADWPSRFHGRIAQYEIWSRSDKCIFELPPFQHHNANISFRFTRASAHAIAELSSCDLETACLSLFAFSLFFPIFSDLLCGAAFGVPYWGAFISVVSCRIPVTFESPKAASLEAVEADAVTLSVGSSDELRDADSELMLWSAVC